MQTIIDRFRGAREENFSIREATEYALDGIFTDGEILDAIEFLFDDDDEAAEYALSLVL